MPKQVLVVDDEEQIVRVARANLEHAGYRVRAAYSGEQALAAVEEERPDLVICDIMMPGLNGFEVVKRLRQNPGTQELPVIFLTARQNETDMADGWFAGVDAYVTKPFTPEELLSFVSRLAPLES